ncbi:beta/alpha barrel domain-containing protein [Bdellovibrio reynosensis]|uniref:Nitronate monooxygenase n=1 Tax=Bdellovibrio reynosensis TaxID=2835041 RepID=A0ABY4CCD9_9BACT|nr:nitronate monooxygenase [Bdellovibrio reynosensis]UOF02508.1 nitronate monooxygenase [Bdellovibrio reynosensis]
MSMQKHPIIIQGGMGIAVSSWKLAKTVSLTGQLGVVSGTAINSVLVRRLQDGDKDGDTRRAMKAFPNQAIANQILATYFIEGGKEATKAYKRPPMFTVNSPKALLQLNIMASFVEVWLAKEGHSNPVGINLLEKVVLPNLSCLYGALLADVDYVIMGAGIPREIPGALDLLSENKVASLKVPVEGAVTGDETITSLDPAAVMDNVMPAKLKRPYFFPIVSSSVLAANLKKKATGEVNGFVVEGPLAGGHNAPPRGPMKLNERGEPIYGERDVVDLKEMAALGLPFWMAGSYATPERLKEVQDQGAVGIQAGTLFAFAKESGLADSIRDEVVQLIAKNDVPPEGFIFTDPLSSPTGFPFKAVRLGRTISDKDIYQKRKRICDLGYLRHAYKKPDNTVGLRCPAEPVDDYVKKGGKMEDTIGRKCLCNALMADIGMPQVQAGGEVEQPMLTAGDDLNLLGRILKPGQLSYSATEVIDYLLK